MTDRQGVDAFFRKTLCFLQTLGQECHGQEADQRAQLIRHTIQYITKLQQDWEQGGVSRLNSAAHATTNVATLPSVGPSEPSINPTPTDELDNCAICLDVILKQEHAVGRLACGHEFHLSCIGSYFNCSGRMLCPNCRRDQVGLPGNWDYADGPRRRLPPSNPAPIELDLPPPPSPPPPFITGGINILRRLIGMPPTDPNEEARVRALAGIEFEPIYDDDEDDGTDLSTDMDRLYASTDRMSDDPFVADQMSDPFPGGSLSDPFSEDRLSDDQFSVQLPRFIINDEQQEDMSEDIDWDSRHTSESESTTDPSDVNFRHQTIRGLPRTRRNSLDEVMMRRSVSGMDWSQESDHVHEVHRWPTSTQSGESHGTDLSASSTSNTARMLDSARQRLFGWTQEAMENESEGTDDQSDESEVTDDQRSDTSMDGAEEEVVEEEGEETENEDSNSESDYSSDIETIQINLTGQPDAIRSLDEWIRNHPELGSVIRDVTDEVVLTHAQNSEESGEDGEGMERESEASEDEASSASDNEPTPTFTRTYSSAPSTPRHAREVYRSFEGTPDSASRMSNSFQGASRHLDDQIQACDIHNYSPGLLRPPNTMTIAELRAYHASLPASSPPDSPDSGAITRPASPPSIALRHGPSPLRHQQIERLSPNARRYVNSPRQYVRCPLSRTSSSHTIGEQFFSADEHFNDDVFEDISGDMRRLCQEELSPLRTRTLTSLEEHDVRMERTDSESSTGYCTCQEANDLLSSPSSPIPYPRWRVPSPLSMNRNGFIPSRSQSPVFNEATSTIEIPPTQVLADEVAEVAASPSSDAEFPPLSIASAAPSAAATTAAETDTTTTQETGETPTDDTQPSRKLLNLQESLRAIQSVPIWPNTTRDPDYYFTFDETHGTAHERFQSSHEPDDTSSQSSVTESQQYSIESPTPTPSQDTTVSHTDALVAASEMQSSDFVSRPIRRVSGITRPLLRMQRRSLDHTRHVLDADLDDIEAHEDHNPDAVITNAVLSPALSSAAKRSQDEISASHDITGRPARSRRLSNQSPAHSYDAAIEYNLGRQHTPAMLSHQRSRSFIDDERPDRELQFELDEEGVDAANVHRRDPNLDAMMFNSPSDISTVPSASSSIPTTPLRGASRGRRRKRRSASVESDVSPYASSLAEIQRRPLARVYNSAQYGMSPRTADASLLMSQLSVRTPQMPNNPGPQSPSPAVHAQRSPTSHRYSLSQPDASSAPLFPTGTAPPLWSPSGEDNKHTREQQQPGRQRRSWISNKLRRLSIARVHPGTSTATEQESTHHTPEASTPASPTSSESTAGHDATTIHTTLDTTRSTETRSQQ